MDNTFEKYLKERYEDQVKWYSDKSSQHKRYYHWFQWAAIVISASLPVLVLAIPAEFSLVTVVFSTGIYQSYHGGSNNEEKAGIVR